MARRWLCGVGVLVLALTPVACGGGRHAASRPAGPPLSRVCGGVPGRLQATTSWLETSDRVRLFSVEAGSGSTGVVLAHESPGGLCGWLPALPTFTDRLAGNFPLLQNPGLDQKSNGYLRLIEAFNS